MLQLTI